MCKARPRRYCFVLGAAVLSLLNASGALALSASFSWCSGSPRFQLSDVPQGTVKLDFHMIDLNKPSFHHRAVRRIRERLRWSVAAAWRGTHL
jgi:hypothetical protein